MSRALPPFLAGLALIAMWEWAHRSLGLSGVPSPFAAFAALPELLSERSSFADVMHSLRRMFIGYGIAAVFGIALGLLMGTSEIAAKLFNPLIMMIYPIPKAALMPILMIWLGIGDASKILVIFLGASLPIIYHAWQGAKSVSSTVVWSAAAMGMGSTSRLFRIILPAALPEIFIGLRTGLILALITMVVSEIVARSNGIGNLLFNSMDMALYDRMFATIIIIAAMGYLLDLTFEAIRTYFLRWADTRDHIELTAG
ncbi:ABC transporter permease subunit [Paracoccus sp. S-4012]|uniref:ABC transporter permease n=1 Tax=Paracoccus sp. S-4012 TaxID=2665648 RepID=UPI0012B02863|nr:ABC transporter permease [Paracoccus sp. S-4012]MRX50032.1 ABC transporter permease subunit [Paracoccus sp. S-4012]